MGQTSAADSIFFPIHHLTPPDAIPILLTAAPPTLPPLFNPFPFTFAAYSTCLDDRPTNVGNVGNYLGMQGWLACRRAGRVPVSHRLVLPNSSLLNPPICIMHRKSWPTLTCRISYLNLDASTRFCRFRFLRLHWSHSLPGCCSVHHHHRGKCWPGCESDPVHAGTQDNMPDAGSQTLATSSPPGSLARYSRSC